MEKQNGEFEKQNVGFDKHTQNMKTENLIIETLETRDKKKAERWGL